MTFSLNYEYSIQDVDLPVNREPVPHSGIRGQGRDRRPLGSDCDLLTVGERGRIILDHKIDVGEILPLGGYALGDGVPLLAQHFHTLSVCGVPA